MNVERISNGKAKKVAVALIGLVILLPVGYSVATYVFARGVTDTMPFIEMPDSRYEECVRETTYMRYHHWELLRQIRDEVVRDGKRGDISLNSCRECHPNRGQFCNRCHKAVSLSPDCFGCHYYPETSAESEDMAELDGSMSRAGRAALVANVRPEE